ncbi:hypothetical protein BS47DRAFT_1363849 [Hydnum rufescens UP504]|uniref:Uncharacterized protein n=1 Tax=Hydnum rufescens UP504 TaxID=1448309 RepID=A0A9P6DU67_9AGAM|nr:hypothetical protein BS47DRAFT_1363849 [Hydnum rufescens UP504]
MARVCTYASKGRSGGKWHACTGSSDLVAHRSSIRHGGVIRDAPPPREHIDLFPLKFAKYSGALELRVYIAMPSPQSTFRNTPKAKIPVLPDALVLSHYYYNPNPTGIPSDYGPQCQQEKGRNQGEGVNLEGPSESDEHKQDILYSRYNSRGAYGFFALVPLTAIWWHDKHSGYVLETKCNDAMSKIGFYSIKDMTRDGLNLSTSFASVHVLLSTFTSEADAISAGFDKAPAMFFSYTDTLRDFPEGVYVPSPLPPYFDHPFLPHKWYAMPSSLFIAPPVSSTVGSSAAGSSAAGSLPPVPLLPVFCAGSSAAGSSAVSVKRTLPPLLRFTKRQRTEGVVAEGGDVMMEDGGNVSVPPLMGDRDVMMQDGLV